MNARWMFSPAIALAGALGGLVLMHGAVRAQEFGGTAFDDLFSAPEPMQHAGDPPCMKRFVPLRAEATRRAKIVQAAGQRQTRPAEACKLIGNFSRAEEKMLKFMEVNTESCDIPFEITGQLQGIHLKTTQLLKLVCDAAVERRS